MKYLIWSNEHNAWWARNHNGYVESRNQAGRYSFEEAEKICLQANIAKRDGDRPDEAMVPEDKNWR